MRGVKLLFVRLSGTGAKATYAGKEEKRAAHSVSLLRFDHRVRWTRHKRKHNKRTKFVLINIYLKTHATMSLGRNTAPKATTTTTTQGVGEGDSFKLLTYNVNFGTFWRYQRPAGYSHRRGDFEGLEWPEQAESVAAGIEKDDADVCVLQVYSA